MKSLLLFVAALLTLAACGPDSILVESGKRHGCNIAALEAQIAANPTDESLQAELLDTNGMLVAVIDTADEGDRADLQAAIQEAVAAGCD